MSDQFVFGDKKLFDVKVYLASGQTVVFNSLPEEMASKISTMLQDCITHKAPFIGLSVPKK